jgi:hypothetical protein
MGSCYPVAEVIKEAAEDLSTYYGTIEQDRNCQWTVHKNTGRNGVDEIRHSNRGCKDTQMLCHHLSLYSPVPVEALRAYRNESSLGRKMGKQSLAMLMGSQSVGFRYFRKYLETSYMDKDSKWTPMAALAGNELERYETWLDMLTPSQKAIWDEWCSTENPRLRIIFMTA